MQFEHIVVGVDFSETSREAVRTAAQLVDTTARLTLVHVWHAAHPYSSFSGDELRAAVANDEATMAEWKLEAQSLGARNVSWIFLAGNPADELIELAHKDPSIDLIILGTHGRTGLAHVLMGSVAEKVMRRSPCAVMSIPAQISRARRRHARQPAPAHIH